MKLEKYIEVSDVPGWSHQAVRHPGRRTRVLRAEGMHPAQRGSGAPWSLPKAIVGFRNLSRDSHGRRLTPGRHAIAGWAGVVGRP